MKGANGRVTNAKSSMLQDNNPDAACMSKIQNTYEYKHIEEKDNQCCILLRSKLKANPSRITTALREYSSCIRTFVGRADFDFFVRFENTACYEYIMLNDSVCLLALSHSNRHVLASRLCAG